MVREIIKNSDAQLSITLPTEMVGKTIEVLAFEIDPSEINTEILLKGNRLSVIQKISNSSLIDLSTFVFNRDQANNYND